jgi:hypothetical protein
MRNISFMLTTDQIRNRTKTVTRRLGWKNLKVGDRLQACVKCQGLKPGEKIEKLCVIRVTDVRKEPLNHLSLHQHTGVLKVAIAAAYDHAQALAECKAEGFPHLTPEQFVQMFMHEMKCPADQTITRIEFTYE